jgi:hypothetical protein
MVRLPFAGNVLAYAQYVCGFERLRHEVMYLETSGWPNACYDPTTKIFGDDPTPGLIAVDRLLKAIGVEAKVVYVDTAYCHGMAWPEVKRAIASADVLIDVGGVCWLPEFESCRRRALIDMDPFFTQVGRFAGESLDRYHVHFSYGTNIGRADCTVPTKGIDWKPLVPPVVPELWRGDEGTEHTLAQPPRFTTIANWSAYGSVEHNGRDYGQKDKSFAALADLPGRVGVSLEIAASGIPLEDVAALEEKGWCIRSGAEVSRDWQVYRDFITASDGEFSAAKHGYVASRSGWISDRTVCYLAAGRPVIVQDTAIPPQVIARSDGFVMFATIDEAADAIHNVTADYNRHQLAAADLAHSLFSYRITLPGLLEQALEPGHV